MSALTPRGSTRRWRRLRRLVLERDQYRCRLQVDAAGVHVEDDDPAAERLCLAYADHVDHIIERQAGGTDAPSNLRAACELGNLSRRPNGRHTNQPNGTPTITQTVTSRDRSWSW